VETGVIAKSEGDVLRIHRWTLVALVCQLADIITTHVAFLMGFVEGNPIARGIVERSEYLMYGIKMGLIGLGLVIVHKRGYWWLAALMAMAGAYAAGINLITING
jgi:hypothetical protein